MKKLNKEFEFYNVRFYREERVREPTVCVDYPCGNPYWYTDFKKFIKSEILDKDVRYEAEWNNLLARLKNAVHKELKTLQDSLNAVDAKEVLRYMSKYSLRDYQAFDMLQLMSKMNYSNDGGLILSEQRTGKTRVALSTMLETTSVASNVLIVCPPAAVSGWRDECRFYAEKWMLNTTVIRKAKDIKDLHLVWNPSCRNIRIITYNLFKMLTIPQIRLLCGTANSKELTFTFTHLT